MTDDIDYRAMAKWLATGKTGASSKFMAAVFLGDTGDSWTAHPLDGGDFMRCVGLLRAVPGLRDLLPMMRGQSKYWAALVDAWDQIEAAPPEHRYQLMQQILIPIEDSDPDVTRVGNVVMQVRR